MPSESEITIAAALSASALAGCLAQRQTDRVVFAESCTAGLVAALLGQVPGISNWLCGSAVTYRQSAKIDWLGVSPQTLLEQSAESQATTSEMALGVLRKTAEATFSAAVTGHLGPNAPPEIDGQVYIAVARRHGDAIEKLVTEAIRLVSTTRIDRQHEAAKAVLDLLISQLT